MIIRAILGVVLSGGLSFGALYGAGEYLDIRAASADGVADIEPGEPEVVNSNLEIMPVEEEPVLEDRLPLPYADGNAASWLASELDGTGPYDVGGDSVDLAGLASRAAAGDGAEARCDAAHVALVCNLTDSNAGVRYSFGLQNDVDGGYEIPEGSVRSHTDR